MSFSVHNTSDEEVLTKMNYVQKKIGTTVINRGNPSSDNTLLLDDFNTIHYYTYTGGEMSDFSIPTLMVENAVYEVYFNCSGSIGSNNDMRLCPYGSYSSYFYTHYQTSEDNETQTVIYRSSNENAGFFFDFFRGSKGFDPVGKITIYNDRRCKKMRVEAGDSSSNVAGTGYWLDSSSASENYSLDSITPLAYDTSNTWNGVGLLQFGNGSFTNWRIRVSRVA